MSEETGTTTRSAFAGVLRAVPESLDTLGTEALSEVARSATMAQNLAAATRLQAAHLLVQAMGSVDRGSPGPADAPPFGDSRPAYSRLEPTDRARDHLAAAMSLTGWHASRLVTAGVQVHTRLPRLRKAIERGLFP
ncbi:hypothetical protein G6023_10640, partial [Dietzia sp. DQ11-71]|nr:hypothetical protein [Dietzia sp. DQ11-71]